MAREERTREGRILHVERLWTPAQVVALVLGLIFVVLGGVALLRTGMGGDLLDPTTTVAGLSYTPLLGLIEVIFGLLLIAMGSFPAGSDAVVFLGVLLLAFGLLVVIEPAAFESSIAAGRAHGWFYVVTGAIAAVTALASPAFARRRATYLHSTGAVHEQPVGASPASSQVQAQAGTDTRRIDLTEEERRRTRRS
ncbi:MAG: DUF4383 domain-containing protein [Actinomycetota bacterium]|nr:DUF4383 domain-containing protein [Actinomycetota bacterium]